MSEQDITIGAFVYRPLGIDNLYVRQFSGTEFIRWQELTPKVNGSVLEQMEFLASIVQMTLHEIKEGEIPKPVWASSAIPMILDTYSVPFLKRVVVTALEVSELKADTSAVLGKQ